MAKLFFLVALLSLTPVSVTGSFRNHLNLLIWWSIFLIIIHVENSCPP